jgi:hypothetical protein
MCWRSLSPLPALCTAISFLGVGLRKERTTRDAVMKPNDTYSSGLRPQRSVSTSAMSAPAMLGMPTAHVSRFSPAMVQTRLG